MLLRWLGEKEPRNYATPFFVGFALFSFSIFLLSRSKEPYYPRQREPMRGYWRYLRWALGLVRRDRNFARYLLVRALLPCAWLFPISLYSAYAREVFGVSPSTVIALFTPMLYAGQIMCAPLVGLFGDRLGFKSLLVVGSAAMAASLGVGLTLPLWGGRVVAGFVLVYLLFGVGYASTVIGNFNIVMEFAHVEDRPAYMGLAATFGAPSILLVPVLGGWLVDRTDYPPVMVAALVIALAVGVIAAFGFKEPRAQHPDLEGLGLKPV